MIHGNIDRLIRNQYRQKLPSCARCIFASSLPDNFYFAIFLRSLKKNDVKYNFQVDKYITFL